MHEEELREVPGISLQEILVELSIMENTVAWLESRLEETAEHGSAERIPPGFC